MRYDIWQTDGLGSLAWMTGFTEREMAQQFADDANRAAVRVGRDAHYEVRARAENETERGERVDREEQKAKRGEVA